MRVLMQEAVVSAQLAHFRLADCMECLLKRTQQQESQKSLTKEAEKSLNEALEKAISQLSEAKSTVGQLESRNASAVCKVHERL